MLHISSDLNIGFETESYTFNEVSRILSVPLVKGPNNRSSEQAFNIKVSAGFPSGRIKSAHVGLDYVVDLVFPERLVQKLIFWPYQQRLNVQFRIIDDLIPEETEAFLLDSSRDIEGTFETTFECIIREGCFRSTLIHITDNDGKKSI